MASDESYRIGDYRDGADGLVPCPRCKALIPAHATMCPECGVYFRGHAYEFAERPKRRPARAVIEWVGVVLSVLVMAAVILLLILAFR